MVSCEDCFVVPIEIGTPRNDGNFNKFTFHFITNYISTQSLREAKRRSNLFYLYSGIARTPAGGVATKQSF